METAWWLVALTWLTGFAGLLYLLRTVFARRLQLLERLERYGTRRLERPEEVVERELAAARAAERRARPRERFGLGRRLSAWLGAMDRRLQAAGIPMKGKEFALACGVSAAAGAVLGYFLLPPMLTPLAAVPAAGLPYVWLSRVEAARRRRLKEQIPELLVMMRNALQAGHGFLQAAQIASRELGPPVGEEIQKLLQETSMGATTEAALRNLGDRILDDDMEMVITAVLIQRQVGGNLAEVLANIHETIRERIRLQGHISALTAQGRLSGVIISILPIAIAGFIFLNSPDFLAPLIYEPLGRMLLAAAVFLELAGIYLIRRIVHIEV